MTTSAPAAPSNAPELLAEGIVSTPDDETGIAFAPDGRTAYFTKKSPTTNMPPRSVICVTRRAGARWAEPEIASFSGVANDFGVAVSHDGNRVVFTSDRGAKADAPDYDLWLVERDGNRWSDPRPLGDPVDTPANEAYPSLASDGTLYFASSRPGGAGGSDLWRSRLEDGRYAAPENLADINTAGYESQPAIAPNQSYIVFVSSDRDDTLKGEGAPYSRTDLYVSFRDGAHWTKPRRLDPPIDTAFNESGPSVSPDGTWLYFASDRGFASVPMPRMATRAFERALHGTLDGWSNIYRVPVSAIGAHALPAAGSAVR
jgi:hypothetical protein